MIIARKLGEGIDENINIYSIGKWRRLAKIDPYEGQQDTCLIKTMKNNMRMLCEFIMRAFILIVP